MKDFVIHCLFKASGIAQKTGKQPAVVFDESFQKVVFVWPYSDDVKKALDETLAPEFQKFVSTYKFLRSEMNLAKPDSKRGANDYR